MKECGIEIHVSNTGTVEKIFNALHAQHVDATVLDYRMRSLTVSPLLTVTGTRDA